MQCSTILLLCNMYQKKLIITKDGSHSIELIGQNEQYHSIHGAIQESQHVFIEYGLKRIAESKNKISILEVGMGTGLNVMLTYIYSQKRSLKIDYFALEPFPVSKDIWQKLNYTEHLHLPIDNRIFEQIHSSKWDKEVLLSDNFKLIKSQAGITDIDLNIYNFDLVYFDAFNPDLEPNLWTEEVFQKIYNSMKNKGILSTYSTKGIVKRALKSCGFSVEKKPGPPGKREILNAVK